MECTYAIACKSDNDNLSCCTQFDPYGNGEKLWKDLAENGKLTDASTDEKLKGMAQYFSAFFLLMSSMANSCKCIQYTQFILSFHDNYSIRINSFKAKTLGWQFADK